METLRLGLRRLLLTTRRFLVLVVFRLRFTDVVVRFLRRDIGFFFFKDRDFFLRERDLDVLCDLDAVDLDRDLDLPVDLLGGMIRVDYKSKRTSFVYCNDLESQIFCCDNDSN